MKKQRHILKRLLGVALALVMTVVLAVPASSGKAEAADPGQNLTITINNAAGLPGMVKGQFKAFQIFKGRANEEIPDPDENITENDYNASNWNNYTLSDIQWGDGIDAPALIKALQELSWDEYGKPGSDVNNIKSFSQFFDDKTHANKFKNLDADDPDPEAVAEILVGESNDFLQEFCKFIVSGANGLTSYLIPDKGHDSVLVDDQNDDASDDKSIIEVPEQGYYLVMEHWFEHYEYDAVSEFILAVLGDQEIDLKASIPTVDKEIVGDASRNKGDVAGVGDTVTFKLTGTLAKNFDDFTTYYYSFMDTLSPGLTFIEGSVVVTVKIGETIFTVDPSQYLVATEDLAEGKGQIIHISFEDLRKGLELAGVIPGGHGTLDASSEIYVEYKATLNENAKIGSAGNPNDVYLQYSNDPNSEELGKTTEKRVYVYSFGLDLTKVGSDNAHKSGLKGASFTLKREDGKIAVFKNLKDGVGKTFDHWADATVFDIIYKAYKSALAAYDKATNEERSNPESQVNKNLKAAFGAMGNYILTSGEDGSLPDVYGIDEGEYTLTEVVTPDGYNTMEDFTFKIKANINQDTGVLESVQYYAPAIAQDPTATYDATGSSAPKDETELFKGIFEKGLLPETLENQKAPFLPFTGGIGTVIFYVTGGLLIAGAVTYFVVSSKKRKKAEQAK